MGACDRDFGLVWPCAAEVAYSARGQGSRLGVDDEFRNRAFAEPAGIVPGDSDHVGRGERRSVVSGKRVSVRVDRGGRRIIKQNRKQYMIKDIVHDTYDLNQKNK